MMRNEVTNNIAEGQWAEHACRRGDDRWMDSMDLNKEG